MGQGIGKTLTMGELLEAWTPYGVDLLLHDPGGPGECLVRRGELVALSEHADSVTEHLGRWVDRVEHRSDLRLSRVLLRKSERDRCVDIACDSAAGRPVAVNHVHLGAPVLFGTGARARAAAPVELPDEPPWDPPVTVGVLDTGLDPHPWFAGRPWFEAVPEVLDADDDSGQDRQAGHGTFVAGVVLRHAPGVSIRTRPVLSSLGFTDDVRVAEGLRELRRAKTRTGVLLLTAGCYTHDDECPPVLRAELERFEDVVVVAAAGNHGLQRPFWPAALPSVIGVAGTGSDGDLAAFSNHGSWVDAAAPAVDVVSSHVRLRSGGPREYGFARWSGTSFAAPVIAAAAAAARSEGADALKAAEIVRRNHAPG